MTGQESNRAESAADNRYVRMAKIFRALSDPKRVKIVDMLSCGEMCGCVLLKCFEITQPTLAHDMKVLSDAGVVVSRRNGKRIMYSLNREVLERAGRVFREMLQQDAGRKSCSPDE